MNKLSLNEGGYDYKFIEEPAESLKCAICLLVVREPQQHGGCGKLFCKVCIDKHKTLRNDCPCCRRPLGKYTIFHDLKSEQEVKSLLVRCPTACEWKGELRSLKDHIRKVCENTSVPCPNYCNGGKTTLVRRNLDYHLADRCPNRLHTCTKCQKNIVFKNANNHKMVCPKRQYTCPHCRKAGVYDERTTTHLKVCPKVEINCRKCLLKIFRCDESDHLLVCPNEPVQCTYYRIGCEEKPLRKNLAKHVANTQLHLSLATEEVLKLKNIILLKSALTFRMKHFDRYKFDDKENYSPPFLTSASGYKMCIRVDANGSCAGEGTHVSVYVCLMKGDNDDSLSWPFTGTVTVELLNQLEDKNHQKGTTIFTADLANSQRVMDGDISVNGWGWRKFISHADLAHKPLTNCQYLKDDTLIFRVSAEAPDYKPWLECTN
ncbi:TNF receptor-associated factor 2-like isoform X3 [Halichondria panicea]|uniref:TNF receptor-associated factor 2-like isoform X3 n=1 Tax=Halichondria panicea TaxID=6063 RepID=UPI00312B4D48